VIHSTPVANTNPEQVKVSCDCGGGIVLEKQERWFERMISVFRERHETCQLRAAGGVK
jgi:hypothetical protein